MNRPAPVPASVPTRPLQARIRSFKGKILVSVDNTVLELSDTAAQIWRWIDGVRTADDIAVLLAEEYDVDRETALTDVIEFVAELAEAGIADYAYLDPGY